jgi:SpoVK/Ycf46/Vps4 family AAA+-type ATPase
MRKLLASYGRDEEFRAVAEQIILEEEKKHNSILAKSLRKTLEQATVPQNLKGLSTLAAVVDPARDFIERIEPTVSNKEITLSAENERVFSGLLKEFRHSDEIRLRGLPVRSKLLLCGPPGCGKTLYAEIFAGELGMPLFMVKLDRLISSYLGETATNIRKIFEFAAKRPCVLFLDEFDALARSREDTSEHSELRRVVNSLLLFIDRLQPKGFLVAATNLDKSLDQAIWRRFDEVLWFDKPTPALVERFLRSKLKNVRYSFDIREYVPSLKDYSYAEIERICVMAIKWSIIRGAKEISEGDFKTALADEKRRRARVA